MLGAATFSPEQLEAELRWIDQHVRMLKSRLSEAWEQPGAPKYLPTPLQGILYNEAHARVVRAKRRDLYSFPAGQVIGMLDHEERRKTYQSEQRFT